jgi:hypothetical protein
MEETFVKEMDLKYCIDNLKQGEAFLSIQNYKKNLVSGNFTLFEKAQAISHARFKNLPQFFVPVYKTALLLMLPHD